MRTIYKYSFPGDVVPSEPFTIRLPRGAQLLTLQMQAGRPFLWCLIDTDNEEQDWRMVIYGTGRRIAPGPHVYIGTYQNGAYVWHLFEVQ